MNLPQATNKLQTNETVLQTSISSVTDLENYILYIYTLFHLISIVEIVNSNNWLN